MRPRPLSTDGSNAFAHYSMTVRVPKILHQVREQNPDYPPAVHDAVNRLADDIRQNHAVPPLGLPALDEGEWPVDLARRTWLCTEWFFAECYVYRSLAAAVRYWENERDPFAPAKREELASSALWAGLEAALEGAPRADRERLVAILEHSLWGNRVDLSYGVGAAFGRAGASHDLLRNDADAAAHLLLAAGDDVHLVADNTGSELSMDLVLADAVLSRPGARVSLHVKVHPMFVSDATVADVWNLLSAMHEKAGSARDLAGRLRNAFATGRLRILPDFFWNGPRFLWDRPARLAAELDRATLVILKGDANYRRAVGDALWMPETSLVEVAGYFPAPLLLLRTLKSDAVAGLPAGVAAKLDAVDTEWRINGRRGVIQLKP